ncbi:MAG: hypothetical protein GC205_04860 [Bacteroidetes bacterium]|nr:hypothetical protein [Bacteroidota bacterium]
MFSGIPSDPAKRLDLVLQVICLALGALVFLSHPLWLSERNYPMAPLLSWIPAFSFPLDAVVAGVFIVLPFLILFSRSIRGLTIAYLLLYIVLIMQDQNRLQPYYVQLLAMLLVVSGVGLGRKVRELAGAKQGGLSSGQPAAQPATLPATLPAGQSTLKLHLLSIVLFGTYLWAGIHKINPYFQERFADFGAGYWIPVAEISLALGLLWPSTRRVAVVGLVCMHLGIAVALSPWFYGWNLIVIPWNLALGAINVLVFWPAKESALHWLRPQGTPLLQPLLILVFVLLPALNLVGRWDHYLSASLYSYKVPFAKIYLAPEHAANLPEHIEKYVFDDEQGLFVEVTYWAMGELQTAPYPEERVYEQVRAYLCNFSPGDSCMARLVYYW